MRWHGPCGCKAIRLKPSSAQTQTIKGAERMDHPASLVVVLAWAASVFLWTGDLRSAEEHINSSISRAESHSLEPLVAVGQARKAELAIRRGDAKSGVERLRASLEKIHAMRYELITTEFDISLVQGLAAIGRLAEGMTLIDETMRRVEANGDALVHAGVASGEGRASVVEAAAQRLTTRKSALCNRSNGAGARARVHGSCAPRPTSQLCSPVRDDPRRGRALLQPVFEQFKEGLDTVDLKAAWRVLARMA